MYNPMDDRWRIEELCNAIILQAVSDYRRAVSGLRRPRSREARDYLQQELQDVTDFFRSDWFHELTTADGNTILRRLEGEMHYVEHATAM